MFASNINQLKLCNKRPDKPVSTRSVVRKAYPEDIAEVLELVQEFRHIGWMPSFREDYNQKADLSILKKVLYNIIRTNGVFLIAENNTGTNGYIFGHITESIWAKGAFVLEQVGFYARTKRVGHDLLHRYMDMAIALKQKGTICGYLMNEMSGVSPDYSKFGMKMIERRWIA
jgi:hypothetical protein